MPPESPAPEGAEAPVEGAAPATPEPTPTAAPVQPEGFDRIFERMDEMSSQQQQLVEQMSQVLAPPEEEPEFYDEGGELTDEGVRSILTDFVRDELDTRLSERDRRTAVEQRDLDWEDLLEDVPELKDPKYSKEIIDWAADLVGRDERFIDSPRFVELIKLVHAQRKLDEHVAAQAPAEGRGVVLESASGAAQATKGSDDVDWGDRIVKAADRLRPQI